MERLSGDVSHPCRDRSGLTNAGVAGGVVGALVAADYFWPGSSSSTLIPLFTRSLSLSLSLFPRCVSFLKVKRLYFSSFPTPH